MFSTNCSRVLSTLSLLVATGVLSALPARGAELDYGRCLKTLLELEIATEQAVASCGGSRFPEALASCVDEVAEEADLAAAGALAGCERSRRPEEVADCTTDIYRALNSSATALDYCSRTLLPERYSACVIDVAEVAELTADDAMVTCIRAGYRPWNAAPRL